MSSLASRQAADVASTRARGGMVSSRPILALSLLLLAFPLTGCSLLLAHTYMANASDRGYAWHEIPWSQTQPEVRAALGEPAQAVVCPDGRRLDMYHLPMKFDACVMDDCSTWGKTDETVMLFLMDLQSLGLGELFFTPYMLYRIHRSEQARGAWHVAFMYDATGAVLYRYEAVPGEPVDFVLAPLTDAVHIAVDTGGPTGWRDSLGHQVGESRRRAACLGYVLTPEEAQRVEWVERIAEAVDADRLAREAGRDALSACYLRTGGLCPADANAGLPAPD